MNPTFGQGAVVLGTYSAIHRGWGGASFGAWAEQIARLVRGTPLIPHERFVLTHPKSIWREHLEGAAIAAQEYCEISADLSNGVPDDLYPKWLWYQEVREKRIRRYLRAAFFGDWHVEVEAGGTIAAYVFAPEDEPPWMGTPAFTLPGTSIRADMLEAIRHSAGPYALPPAV